MPVAPGLGQRGGLTKHSVQGKFSHHQDLLRPEFRQDAAKALPDFLGSSRVSNQIDHGDGGAGMLVQLPGDVVGDESAPAQLLLQGDEMFLEQLQKRPQAVVRIAQESAQQFHRAIACTSAKAINGCIDAICAQKIAEGAADIVEAYVAPTIAYTPAPFNTAFPGTLSVSEPLFEALVGEILDGLIQQGFEFVYFVNGHGANLAPLKRVTQNLEGLTIRIRSWWEFKVVNELRDEFYGAWEGMHATPSEVSITQAINRVIEPGSAEDPPKKLSIEYIRKQSGDRHGPPEIHRAQFPDGRVGSHSALANPGHGQILLNAAITALANDYLDLLNPGKSSQQSSQQNQT